jgi:hypothetical protein
MEDAKPHILGTSCDSHRDVQRVPSRWLLGAR